MRTRQTLTVGRDRFRVGPWQGVADVAYLAVGADPPRTSVDGLRGCLGRLADGGYRSVVTAALHPSETEAFVANGFDELDRLLVLTHDMVDIDPDRRPLGPGLRVRRARPGDRDRALAVEGRAFEPFWRLDRAGLHDAEAATPAHRLRVVAEGGRVLGYAVTGRAGRQGFLQRLAADPDRHGHGIGSALVVDALRWADHHGVRRTLVNTQFHNDRARALYEQLGFRSTPTYLVVLTRALP